MPDSAITPKRGQGIDHREATLREFADMARMVPESDDDADVRMLQAIAGASEAGDLDAFWDSASAEKILGHPLLVSEIKRQPSDFQDGLGIFLVVTATDEETGEIVTFTTGSVAVVGQLVKAYSAGWFPLPCVLEQSPRKTRAGYYPQRLRIRGEKVPFPSGS